MKTKLCSGPGHETPVELPLTDDHWYFRKSRGREGQALARCKRCVNWDKLKKHEGDHGTVPVADVTRFVREIVGRVGFQNAARELDVSAGTLRAILSGQTRRVQKRTVKKILIATHSLRSTGTVYHRQDIAAGVYTKKRLRKVTHPKQQYGPVYPELEREIESEIRARNAAYKRKSRQKEKERALAYQRFREEQLKRLAGY